jgi:NAD(P)H-hydrate epimerase
MRILTTPEEMRAFDAAAAGRFGIPGIVLMENAGRGVADRIVAASGDVAGKRVTVLCGKGNNGGDGFVVARQLLLRGAIVDVILLARPSAVSGDAHLHLSILQKLIKTAGHSLRFSSQPTRFAPPPGGPPAIVIDAIFGTGFTGAPRGVTAAAIRWINASGAYVVAIDIPSGLDGATGNIAGEAVRAHRTVTMAAEKIGQYCGAGPEFCGQIDIVDIGITPAFCEVKGVKLFRHDDASVARILPRRQRTVHKYSAGKVLVIGGSRQYAGAPTFAALAALRSGAGAVVLAVPSGIRQVIAARTRDVLLHGLPETHDGTIAGSAMGELIERIAWADAVVLGPGLGRNAETDELVHGIFTACMKPLLVDADALTALCGRPARQWRRPAATILTPHAGELARLLGSSSEAVEGDRLRTARESARRFASTLVLKGASTVCASPDGTAIVNTTGNPGMATIGTGDVLSGVIGGLTAQGMAPCEAAAAGVYLHGRAGDLAAQRYGQRSLLASDLLDLLPAALLTVENQ